MQGYKLKFVMLQRNAQKGSKLVIVKETETATENVEYISLDGMWTVQDKISRNSKRYPFEVRIGDGGSVCVCVKVRKEYCVYSFINCCYNNLL